MRRLKHEGEPQRSLWASTTAALKRIPGRKLVLRVNAQCTWNGGSSSGFVLLDPHVIAFPSSKSFRVVHLFRFRRRHDKGTRRRRARHVRILVHAFPQERGERFRPFVAQVLMLEPLGPPPLPAM